MRTPEPMGHIQYSLPPFLAGGSTFYVRHGRDFWGYRTHAVPEADGDLA